MVRRCHCFGRRFHYGIQLLLEVKKDVIKELGFRGLLQIGCNKVNLDLCFWLMRNTNSAYSQLELSEEKNVHLTSHDVGIVMGILHNGRKFIVEEETIKASLVMCLKDIEALMVDIDDIDEFKRLFFIFLCATSLALTSRLEGSHALWYTP